jgi:hypothetical protein
MVIISMAPGSRPPIAWNKALCSESIGNTIEPSRRALSITTLPAHTNVSLLARATARPLRSRRRSDATLRADNGRDHQIGLAQSASSTAAGPAAISTSCPCRAGLQSPYSPRIGRRSRFSAKFDRAFCKRRAVAIPAREATEESAGRGGDHLRAERPIRPVAPRIDRRLGGRNGPPGTQ